MPENTNGGNLNWIYMSDCQQSQFKKLKSYVISGRSDQSEDIHYKLSKTNLLLNIHYGVL